MSKQSTGEKKNLLIHSVRVKDENFKVSFKYATEFVKK